MKIEKTYKDTDLREALSRKYSDTPPLPADFMERMQERMDEPQEAPVPQPMARTRRLWRWVTAAVCLLILAGIGVTMLPENQGEQSKDVYAQNKNPQKTDEKATDNGQEVLEEQTKEKREAAQHPATTAETFRPVTSDDRTPAETSPSNDTPATYQPAKDDHLHYAAYTTEEDSTYQAPARMNDFIAKIADYNHVKEVPLDCDTDCADSTIVNTVYIFKDTKELDLFARLLQAACWYDSKTPGYLLKFSHQQFFFTLKDRRKAEKYIWIAERIDGNRILLFCSHSPIDANVSSVCFQKFREQLTHTNHSTLL
jgi:hypothetical protein